MKKLSVYFVFLVLSVLLLNSCKKDESPVTPPVPTPDPVPEAYYYPPLTGDAWETKTAVAAGWDETKLQAAFDYAATKQTFGMVLLQNGRIVKEQYWNGWDKNTMYYIASAGKSVVAFLTGMAQQDGILNINNKTSSYLGTGWTSLPIAKENLITVKHQITMSTGLDDNVPDQDCTTPACLIYKSDAGTRWAYHNAPYLLMQNVLANASGMTFNQYSRAKLANRIGMSNSIWISNTMWCTTREAARFGSLILSKGKWNGDVLLNDANYYNAMLSTSQGINQSYGYLWWLNGKASFMAPQSQFVFPGSLVPNGKSDMFMALGKDDKKIYVIPSLNAVLVRLGDNATGTATLGPSSFDNELWGRLKLAMNY